jgi:hypothetical protein
MNADEARAIFFTYDDCGEISDDESPDFVEENLIQNDSIDGNELTFEERIEVSDSKYGQIVY